MPHPALRRAARSVTLLVAAAAASPVRAGGNAEVVCGLQFLSGPTCAQGQIVDIAWASEELQDGVRWWMHRDGAINNTNQRGAPLDPALVLAELEAAVAAWEAVPESGITFRGMGTTSDPTPGLDGINVVIWTDTGLGSSTLARTTWTILTVDARVVTDLPRDLNGDGTVDLDPALYPDGTRLRAGTILDADIEMNSGAFDWSLVPNPVPDICDIRAVALHEAGHLHGLSHSAVLREPPTMFAFFDTTSVRQQEAARSLEWDDITASARTYPVAGVGPAGALTSRVLRGGAGVVGAQVSAIEVATGRTVEAVFTNSDLKVGGGGAGAYRLDRLPPGTYQVSVDYLRRNGHFVGGWRWLDSERAGYNVTVSMATLDPFDVSPELLSPTEGSGDDLSPSVVVTLAPGEQRSLNDLVANTAFPPAPAGTTQLFAATAGTPDDNEIIANVPIPFAFSFFGVPYTHFAVYANGYLTFGFCPSLPSCPELDLFFDENGASFFDFPRVAGLLRDLDPGADGLTSGGPDAYVRLGPTTAETIWLAIPEKVPARESGTLNDTRLGANTFAIGFDSAGKIWIEYQRVSAPFGIAGLSAGDGFGGVRDKYDFGRPRLLFPDRPTLENAVPLSGVRVEFTPHAQGGYVASSPQWTAPEVAPPGDVGRLTADGIELTALSWPAAGTPRYNVYRGRVAELAASGAYTSAGSCFSTVTEAQAFDAETPTSGGAFFYLVTAVREFGIEGSLGTNSAGVARPNAVPCRVR